MSTATAIVQEIGRPRVLRVDRHRGHPRAVRAHVGGAGVQDPDRVDGEQPADRRSPAGQQVHLRPDAAGHRPRAAAGPPDPPRRHRRLQVSRRARSRLHQARHRPAGRDDRAEEQEGPRQRPAARRAVRALPDAAVERLPGSHVVRRARALRPGDRAAGPVLRDGRQPRQLAGQPLLGLPAAAATSRARRC